MQGCFFFSFPLPFFLIGNLFLLCKTSYNVVISDPVFFDLTQAWCWCREGEQGTPFDRADNLKLLPDLSGPCPGDFSLKQAMTPLCQG